MPPLSRPRPRRLTQAERREATRTALLDATIGSLVEFGYAGTTTARVAELAGVSRGAQLNYFASKAELVSAAVAHLAQKRIDELRAQIATFPEGDRIPAVLDVIWDAHQGEVFDATLELWVASRTDAGLRASVVALERNVTAAAVEAAVEILADQEPRPTLREDLEFVLATVRGLALLRIASGERSKAVARRWLTMRERLVELLA
jgi:AcrR family transcriptional regulator